MIEKLGALPPSSTARRPRPRNRSWLRRALAVAVGIGVSVAGLPAQALAAPDTTPPVINVEILPSHGTGVWDGWYSQPTKFLIRATDAAGIARVSYRLAGAQTGEAESETSSIEGTISAEGVTLVTMTAADPFGNIATRTYGVGIDVTDPTIDIDGPAVVIQGGEHRVTFSCADPGGAIVSCTAVNQRRPFTSGDLIYTGPGGIQAVAVTAVDRVGRTTTKSFSYNPLVQQTVTRDPAVTGSPRVGGALSITSGTVTPIAGGIDITSRWYVDGNQIAEGTRLPLTPRHVGKQVTCTQTFNQISHLEVTAPCRFAGGGSSIKILPAAWRLLQRPRVAGQARAGQTLRALTPRLSAPAATHRYQWLRNGQPIKSATRAAYKIRKADRGKRISVRVVSTARDQHPLTSISPTRRVQR